VTRTNEHGQAIGDPVPTWAPRERPEPVTLQGAYVRVEPLSSAHYAELFAATCAEADDDLWTYRTVERPRTLPELWMHLAAVLDTPDVTFALVPLAGPSAGTPAGIASYLRIDPANGSIEVGGVLFGRALQRTAAATEAIHLLMRHAIDDLGYRRFEWKCDSLNEPSRRAAVRLGFAYEGRFRNAVVYKGRNRDTDWFAVTDADWPRLRAAHERWLDPANFDGAGAQRTALSDLTAQD
jgi:RimJ/RimL family protein N-acetyltransferase